MEIFSLGMARFCTERYAPPIRANFSNLYAHLTNYSLNKANNAYVHSQSLKDQLQGTRLCGCKIFKPIMCVFMIFHHISKMGFLSDSNL